MKRMTLLSLIALITVSALILCGCGSKEAEETTAAPSVSMEQVETEGHVLGLTDYDLWASTWSSPNGATVHVSAAPVSYADGMTAAFITRLEGEDVDRTLCQWDGTQFTASADLNAADGYCYYLLLTSPTAGELEIVLNAPSVLVDESLINMASSLNAYCNVMVESSEFADSKLTLTGGKAQLQLPRITLADGAITCTEASLTLTFDGEEIAKETLTLPEPEAAGSYELDLQGITFQVPELEDDQQVQLMLNVTMSSGQTLSTPGGLWFYNDGNLLLAVG